MTRKNALDEHDLMNEISDLARRKGLYTEDGWKQLVEQVIEAHRELGEFDDDQALQGMRTELEMRWEEYKRQSQVESLHAIDEDPKEPHV